MAKAVLFGQVGEKYRVVVIKNADQILSKNQNQRQAAAGPLFGTGWRNYYTGPELDFYAKAVTIAHLFQEENGGEIPIYEIRTVSGLVYATPLE